jgi:hypothetical protein
VSEDDPTQSGNVISWTHDIMQPLHKVFLSVLQYAFNFDVCGSVHLGNICFIQIQLDVQYSFFLQSF